MDTYEGIPLDRVPIENIDWEHRAEHIRTRTERYGPAEFDVEPEWATEAALDPERLVSLTDGQSLEVVGLSPSAPSRDGELMGRVLKVWIVPKDLETGSWWGASACEGNERDRRDYREAAIREEPHE